METQAAKQPFSILLALSSMIRAFFSAAPAPSRDVTLCAYLAS